MADLEPKKVNKVLRYRWVVFATLAIIYFFVYFHRVSPAVVAKDIMGTFGVGAASIGLLGSAYFYAYAAMQIPSGLLSDSVGPRRSVALFTLIAAIGALLTGIATSFELVVLGRVLIGLGVAVVYIPVMKILAEWYRTHEFASLTGILLAVGNIGALSAAGPLALMSVAFGWQNVFLGLGLFTVLLAVLCYLLVRDRPRDMGLPDIIEIEEAEGTATRASVGATQKVGLVEGLLMTFKTGHFWFLAVWYFFFYGSLMAYQGLWAGPYFQDVLGWTKAQYGGLLSLIAIGMIFGCPISGYLSDKVIRSRKKVLVLGTLIYTLLWGVLWASAGMSDTLAYAVIYFLMGFFGGFFIVSYAQIKEMFPISIAGTTTAALNVFPFLGGAVLQQITGAMISGYAKTAAGGYPLAAYKAVWLFLFVGMVIATICALLSKEKPR